MIEQIQEVVEPDLSPVKKRGRPTLKKNTHTKKKLNTKLVKTAYESDGQSTSSEPDARVRQTRSRTVQPSSASEYDGSGDESEVEKVTTSTKRTVEVVNMRRSSRTAVLTASHTPVAAIQRSSSESTVNNATSSGSGGGGAFASYMSSAMMRRSRRSRNVDLTKGLVVMLPGDDPREVAQLDLRGEVEWEEFLLAMSEDTSFMASDNEEGGQGDHLPHSSSTYSLSGLADGPPSRSRNTSGSFAMSSPPPSNSNSNYNSNSSSKRTGAASSLDAQQLQYNDVMSINTTAAASEVHIPEVKEAALFKIITAINLLEDPLRASAGSLSTSKARSSKSRDADLHELAQQVLIDKRCGGYDSNIHIMPEHLRHTSEMYVDYDADSDDEQFVRDLQARLRNHPRSLKKQAVAADTPTPPDTDVELKVRCLELMIARLEREFELARLFSNQQSSGVTVVSGMIAAGVGEGSNQIAKSKSNGSVTPANASKQTVLAQLSSTLEQAQASYELVKRFINQPKKSQKKSKAGASKAKGSTSPSVTPTKSTLSLQDYEFKHLEKLFNLCQQRSVLAGSAANAQDSSSLGAAALTRSNSTSDATPAVRPVGRPPLIPRIPMAKARTAGSKPPPAGGNHSHSHSHSHLQKDAPEEAEREPYEEYYTVEQIAALMPEACTTLPLQSILRSFYSQYHDLAESGEARGKVGNKVGRPKSRSNSIADNTDSESISAPVSPFGASREAAIVHEVYLYWQKKRSTTSTSLIRAYHSYIMELWQRDLSVTLPVPGDYLAGSFAESRLHLIQVRRSLDRARLITDRVRRRERLKRDILRLSGEQLDGLRAELLHSLAPSTASPKDSSPPEKALAILSASSPLAVPMVGSNLNSAVATAGQGRDRTGKFLTARQSMAQFGIHTTSKTSPASSSAANGSNKKGAGANSTNNGNNNLGAKSSGGKSMKTQEITFSLAVCSDDELSGTSF